MYTENKHGVTVRFKTGETLFFPLAGRLNFLYAYRPGSLNDENANNTVIAPGPERSKRSTPVDIHAKTAKQMGVTLASRIQGLLNGEDHQDANSLEDTRASS